MSRASRSARSRAGRYLLWAATVGALGCASGQQAVDLPNAPMGMGQIQVDAVTNDPEEETYLRASPDGRALLFNLVSEVERSGSFWDIFRPRSELDQLERRYSQTAIAMLEFGSPGKSIVSQEGAIDPAWFPDSRSFAFSMLQGSMAMLGRSALGARSAAVEFISPTPCTRYDRQPSVHPDGSRVLFTTFSPEQETAVAVTDVETTTSKCTVLFPGREAQWEPEGERFLFTRVVSGRDQVFVFHEEENRLTQVTFGDFDNSDPAWSPDGERIAFTTNRNGDPDIYVIGVDGTGLVQVTQGPTTDRSPAWSADGSLYFVSNAGGNVDIWRAQIPE